MRSATSLTEKRIISVDDGTNAVLDVGSPTSPMIIDLAKAEEQSKPSE